MSYGRNTPQGLQWNQVQGPDNNNVGRDALSVSTLFDKTLKGFTDIADRHLENNTAEALAKIKAADPTGLRTDITAQAYQDAIANAGGNLDLKALQTGYDTLDQRMQTNLNALQDRGMKAQEMSNVEDNRRAELGISSQRLVNDKTSLDQKAIHDAAMLKLRGQEIAATRADAAARAKREQTLFDQGQVRNAADIEAANIAAHANLTGKQAVDNSVKVTQDTLWDKAFAKVEAENAANTAGTFTAPAALPAFTAPEDIKVVLADPSQLTNMATKLGISASALQEQVNAAKGAQQKAEATYITQALTNAAPELTPYLTPKLLAQTQTTPIAPVVGDAARGVNQKQHQDILANVRRYVDTLTPGLSKVIGDDGKINEESYRMFHNITGDFTSEQKNHMALVQEGANNVLNKAGVNLRAPEFSGFNINTSGTLHGDATATATATAKETAAKNLAASLAAQIAENRLVTPEVVTESLAQHKTAPAYQGLVNRLSTFADASTKAGVPLSGKQLDMILQRVGQDKGFTNPTFEFSDDNFRDAVQLALGFSNSVRGDKSWISRDLVDEPGITEQTQGDITKFVEELKRLANKNAPKETTPKVEGGRFHKRGELKPVN